MKYDISALGNALVDTQYMVDHEFLDAMGLEPDSMTLASAEEHAPIIKKLKDMGVDSVSDCGGSATNSLVAASNYGSKCHHVCRVANESEGTRFRVYVTGGGCSGFQYGFKFDSEIAFDDDVIEFENFSVLLDSMSYPYLYGSTLDFVEDLSGSKFVINNPNAKTTCGCGESFTI